MLRNIIIKILILVAIIIFSVNNITYKQEIKKTENIIEKQINKKIEKSNKKDNEINITDDYLGYLEIPKYNIKNLIKEGTDNYILNQNIIGKYKNDTKIDSKKGQLILAGHNNKYVFGKLYKVKINDEIIIKTKEKLYKYLINDIKIIKDNDLSYFNTNNPKKELILITCTSKNKRLLIFAHPK